MLRDGFSYDNPKYAPLRDPARAVVKAYQDANRFFDTAQEYLYIEQGLKYCALAVHRQAHKFPVRFDKFGDMLHERHLMTYYPATPELDWKEEFDSVQSVFSFLIRAFDNIQDALEEFHRVTDNSDFRPMALYTEELMLENSEDYTKFLEMWARLDNDGGSLTSFDSWCKQFVGETEEEKEKE